MEKSYDMLPIDCVEVRKASFFRKSIAVVLAIILISTPLYEFIPQLEPITLCTYGITGTCGCVLGG